MTTNVQPVDDEMNAVIKTTAHTTLLDSFSSEEHEKRSLGEEVDLTDEEPEDQYDASHVPTTPNARATRKSLLAPPSADTIDRYKLMIKSHSQFNVTTENGCGRNNDFYGDSEVQEKASSTSLKTPLSAPPSSTQHKREAMRKKLQGKDRPDNWLGSPSSGRKSYTIKPKSAPTPPPSLDDDSEEEVKATPKVDRRAMMQKASSARLAVPDANDPSVQRFKEMMRAKAFSSSRDFYGTSANDTEVLPPTSPISARKTNKAHKWGAPDPENDMQARPTDFLGSPSSKRRSYRIKGEVTSPTSVVSSKRISMPSMPTTSLAAPTSPRMGGGKRVSALLERFESNRDLHGE